MNPASQPAKDVTPYGRDHTGKKEEVAEMFDNIAANYDFLNHFLSLGIDILWRKKAVRLLRDLQPKRLLDIATGTADFALETLALDPEEVIGLDISPKMLAVGREKVSKRKEDRRVTLLEGDSENIPFESHHFDAITVAFGVRNFEHPVQGLQEMHRVLRPGGRAAIIEFSRPRRFPVRQLYFFYFLKVLPAIGRWFSKDPRAYSYLPESVQAFPDGDDFLALCTQAGFSSGRALPLTFGIASLYLVEK